MNGISYKLSACEITFHAGLTPRFTLRSTSTCIYSHKIARSAAIKFKPGIILTRS